MSSRSPLTIHPRRTPWWRAQRDILARWMTDALDRTPGGHLLKTDLFDEASGPYHHALGLPSRFRFVGIDQDLGVVREARRALGAGRSACVVADVRHLPLGDNSMSLVLSLSTLDHFETVGDIEQSLAELFRVLSAGGRLVLTLDNPSNPEVALRSRLPGPILRRLRADTFPLGRTLGVRQARRALEAAGFEIEREDYLIHSVRYPAIRLLAWLERVAGPAWARRGEMGVAAADILGRLPTRRLTAHYLGWIAAKPRPLTPTLSRFTRDSG
jgi:SAM-dependent methyltransferase